MLLHTIRNALSKHSLIRAKAEEKDLDSANDKGGEEVKKKNSPQNWTQSSDNRPKRFLQEI